MPNINPEAPRLIDEYIDNLPDFSREICIALREIVHAVDPEIQEDWKWGPNFNKNGMICGFGAFKEHVSFTFFEGTSLKDPKKILTEGHANSHNKGFRYKSITEINEKVLIAYIKEGVLINEKGLPKTRRIATVRIPDDFKRALQKADILGQFEATNYTNKKEYALWIENAKKPETRESRIHRAIDRISKGIKFS